MKPIRTDEQLIGQFLTGQIHEAEFAFEALVKRHGPMVLGVCRQVLNQLQDAEDAFQATFLVLARKAGTIQNRRALACWLYEVAYRIAIRARGQIAQHRVWHEVPDVAVAPGLHEYAAAWNEFRPVLYSEVNRLPVKYGVPLALSYLEGKTNKEIAELLDWPVGTVKGRLSRARDMLRARLSRRGRELESEPVGHGSDHSLNINN
jgi:RNA polymerase sigma factor (sigma-70 family)